MISFANQKVVLMRLYDRDAAVHYAQRWALSRNPAYYDFDALGGDCTNFISQCLYAGSRVMNWTPETGWYYVNLNRRAPAWTSVHYLYRFLTRDRGAGPYCRLASLPELEPGDVIQLGMSDGQFYHSLLVLSAGDSPAGIFVAAHTADALWRPLDSYFYERVRCLHIAGVRED